MPPTRRHGLTGSITPLARLRTLAPVLASLLCGYLAFGAASGTPAQAGSATAETLGTVASGAAGPNAMSPSYAAAVAQLDAIVTHDPTAVSRALASSRPTLLAFLDRRCIPCLRMVPVVAEIQREVGTHANVIALDVDERAAGFPELFRRFKIWSGPTFVFVDRSGSVCERRSGPQPLASLRTRLERLATGDSSPR